MRQGALPFKEVQDAVTDSTKMHHREELGPRSDLPARHEVPLEDDEQDELYPTRLPQRWLQSDRVLRSAAPISQNAYFLV
jgi:hypothetical protein